MCDLCWKYTDTLGADGLFRNCPYCGEKYECVLDTSYVGLLRLDYSDLVNRKAGKDEICILKKDYDTCFVIAVFIKDKNEGVYDLVSVGDRIINVDPKDFHEIAKRGFEYLKRLEITEDEEL
jgi:hypothetical protein